MLEKWGGESIKDRIIAEAMRWLRWLDGAKAQGFGVIGWEIPKDQGNRKQSGRSGKRVDV